jgi:ATP/maltotriose-dependent transcriptional regulator MalT
LHVAGLAAVQEDYAAARVCYEESLAVANELRLVGFIATGLKGLGSVAAAQGHLIWAVQLWGAAQNLRESRGLSLSPAFYERMVVATRRQLGEQTFAQAWEVGRSWSPEQALAAQNEVELPPQTVRAPAGLTAREVEVLGLLARGFSNAQIAQALVVSLLTVKAHVRSIYSKLEVTSRAAATRYAIEHRLS